MTKNKIKASSRRNAKPYTSVTYTTGSIDANIGRFNQAMGAGGLGEDLALTEAKRYVRRYYIRPQNIFCSNKAEILKALIELDNANCSVYTLNNLGDEKDVTKLMSSDIIYYYDDGILYDKNKVKVMDYDLSIKHEEERKHFANVDKASEKEFKDAYEDRMTDVTELEEDVFNLTFDDYNVFGERLTENSRPICTHCGEVITGKSYSVSDGINCAGCYNNREATGGL
jgi:hypothetical protein